MKVKLLITDVDGTLTNEDKTLSIHALEGIELAKRAGLKVGLASALPHVILKHLAIYLGVEPIIIGESGGVVEVYDKIVILGDKDEAIKALNHLRRVFNGMVKERWSNKCRLTDIALERTVPYSKICEAVKGFNVKIVDTKYAYHIISSGIDKGVGLKMACSMLNIDPSEIAVVGDSDGDIEMFEVAGVKLAPANATENIKKLASYTSRYGYGKGFKDCIEWLLGKIKSNV